MKILYFSKEIFPNQQKNAYRDVLLCEALTQARKDSQVTLFAQKKALIEEKEIFEQYKINSVFSTVWTSSSDVAYLSWLLGMAGASFYTHENHDFDLHLGSNIIALNAFSDYGQVVAAIINSPTNFFELRALKRIVKTKKLIAILALEKNVHEMLIKKLPSLKSKIFFVEEGSYLKVSKQVLDYAFNLQREQITKNL